MILWVTSSFRVRYVLISGVIGSAPGVFGRSDLGGQVYTQSQRQLWLFSNLSRISTKGISLYAQVPATLAISKQGRFFDSVSFVTDCLRFTIIVTPRLKGSRNAINSIETKKPCGWLRGSGMVGVFLLFRVSLASELCWVKEQLTQIVVLDKLYAVRSTHSNIINSNVKDIRKTNSTFLYYNLSFSGNCCLLSHLDKQSRALTWMEPQG